MPDPLAPRRIHEPAHRFELVVAGEDHRFDPHLPALVVAFLVGLEVDEAREQVEQAVAREDFFPEVGGAVGVSVRIGRVARAAVAAPVEGQEAGGGAGKPGGHEHGLGVDREVDERSALELEDRLARVPVPPVLRARILDGLAGERILELQGGDGNAVQAERHVYGVLRAGREAELAGEPGPVRRVARLELRVERVGPP